MPRPKKRVKHAKGAIQTRWTAETEENVEPLATSTPAASPDRAVTSPPLSPQPVASTSAASPQPTASTSAASPQPIASTSAASPQPTASTSAASPQPIASTSAASPQPIASTSAASPQPTTEEHSITRSAEKISLYEAHVTEDTSESACVRTIVEVEQIQKLVAGLRCPECDSTELTLTTSHQYGLSLKLNVVCTKCNSKVSSEYTSARNKTSPSRPRPFVVNETCVMASLVTGIGAYNFKNFCEYADMPGLHQKTFNTIAKRMYAGNEQLGRTVFSQAAAIVRQEYAHQYNLTIDDDTIVDISVCFDGSWLTRGHKSLIGIGSVIDVLTGLVLDVHVLSLYCQICSQTGAYIKRENPQRYNRWREEHIASRECTINFEGTSGMMEVEAASVLWGRSVERLKLRYTTMVSDGDSKAYNRVVERQPYGPDILVEKEDCLNHVGKRLGTALRNLVADSSKRGITLGGRGRGRLTADTIRKLQIYYCRAIRGFKTAPEMRTAIMASLYHGYSTDDLPQHQYCPSGEDSWCFFKKSIGEHRYPTGHRKRVHTPLDYDRLHQYLEPIYRRLTADDLLRRCEKKTTQNPSESFHHSVWSKCSKSKFHSLKRVQFATTAAAAEYNRGPKAMTTIKKSLGFDIGHYGSKFAKARQHKRVEKSIFETKVSAKQRRKKRAEAREKARQEKEAEEGGPAYQAGMF